LTYVGERLEVREAIDQLEGVLRDVAEELASWRARALKAEGELKSAGSAARTSAAKHAPPPAQSGESEAENKVLRQRVEAARVRVHELLQRLTFLEEQAREPVRGNGGTAAATGTTGAAGAGGAK
jgi:chromosome segregation ATPase